MQHIKHIWPTVKDISDDLDVPYTTAHSWSVRGRIPASYDLDLIAAAKRRGRKLTLEYLANARKDAAPQSIVTHNALSDDASRARQPAPGKTAHTDRVAG